MPVTARELTCHGDEVAGTFGTALFGPGALITPCHRRDSDGNSKDTVAAVLIPLPGVLSLTVRVCDGHCQNNRRSVAGMGAGPPRRKQVADTQSSDWLAAYSFCEGSFL
jgi:hypothetical protein